MILVTHTQPGAEKLGDYWKKKGELVHLESLQTVIYNPIEGGEQLDHLIVTSAHGLYGFNNFYQIERKTVWCLSQSLGALAKSLGVFKVFYPLGGEGVISAKRLETYLLKHQRNLKGTIGYLRGEVIRYLLGDILREKGLPVIDYVIYEAAPIGALSLKTQELLRNKMIQKVTFCSMGAVKVFESLYPDCYGLIALCRSHAIAGHVNRKQWLGVEILI